MARWLAELRGDRMDLEEFPEWFPNGEIFAVEEAGRFYLVGPALDALHDADDVLKAATGALDRFTAVILLRVALSLWADPLRSWRRLNRVLEEIAGER